MPFGMLPVLDVDGELVAQSGTIVRYLAGITGLDGGPSLSGRTRADMIYETAIELKELKSELVAHEKSDLQAMIDGKSGNQKWGKLMALLVGLDGILAVGGGKFFVEHRLTYADLAVFNTFQYFEAIQSGSLKVLGFPKLEDFRLSMIERPKIAAYLATDRCYPFTELEVLTPGYQSNGQPMGLKSVSPLSQGQWQQTSILETNIEKPELLRILHIFRIAGQVWTSVISSKLSFSCLSFALGWLIGCRFTLMEIFTLWRFEKKWL